MCYRVSYLTKKAAAYAKFYAEEEERAKSLESLLHSSQVKSIYQALAQDTIAPELPVITNEAPNEFGFYKWGIVPHWAHEYDDDLRKRFVVSQSEEMFNKNIYKDLAIEKRCLIMIDGYFDHHHRFGKTYPYFIHQKNGDPMMLAGLWSRWIDQKNEMELETVAVLTTQGNKQMQEIHNNPEMLKRKNSVSSRMPVIVPREMWDTWLNPNSIADAIDQKRLIEEVCVPYPDELLESYTTYPLNKGRELVNSEEVGQRKDYSELSSEQLGLF